MTSGRLGLTPSQTVGPYFAMRLFEPGQNLLVPAGAADAIRIEGRILDGDGAPIDDALIEIWQANRHGRYRHPADGSALTFTGFGRAATAHPTGVFWFVTVMPGRVPGPGGALQAPHISVIVQGRGMLAPLFTRIYFEEDAAQHAEDFVLSQVAPDRRSTLVARRAKSVPMPTYRIDLRIQGAGETVFFDF